MACKEECIQRPKKTCLHGKRHLGSQHSYLTLLSKHIQQGGHIPHDHGSALIFCDVLDASVLLRNTILCQETICRTFMPSSYGLDLLMRLVSRLANTTHATRLPTTNEYGEESFICDSMIHHITQTKPV